MKNLLVKMFGDPELSSSREKFGKFEGYTSIALNLLLFIIKLVFGLLSHSYALIADSFHSLSDILTSVIVIVSFKLSSQPPDKEHPYGHGRIEYISTLIIAILLILVGFEFARISITRIMKPKEVIFTPLVLIVVILTIVLKELMARLSFYIGKIIKSETLMADAWHHRSDAISSVLVVISFISVYFGLFAIDGIASFIIALFITYIGINILKKSVNILIGTAPSANVIKNIKDIALHNNDNVISVHDVIINTYGKLSIGSLHIVIPDTLNLVTAHAISDSIEKMIKSEMNMDITVHIDPIDNKDNLLRNLHTYLNSIISGDKNYIEFHDLHILRKDQKISIYFELVFRRSDMNNKEYLIGLLEEKIKHTFNEIDEIYIEVDPEYTY